MKEKTNGKFELKEEHYEFPRIISVKYLETGEDRFIRLMESPFNNCQSFSIARAYKLCELSTEEIIVLFKMIYQNFKRQQLVIDLKDENYEETLELLKCITKNKYSMPYISTNESSMIMNLIQLDTNKLK